MVTVSKAASQWPSYHPPALLCSQRAGPVGHLSLLAPSPALSPNYLLHTPGTSWTVFCLLCCISIRCPISWSPPQEQGPETLRLLPAAYRIFHLPLHPCQVCERLPPGYLSCWHSPLILTHGHSTLSSPSLDWDRRQADPGTDAGTVNCRNRSSCQLLLTWAKPMSSSSASINS